MNLLFYWERECVIYRNVFLPSKAVIFCFVLFFGLFVCLFIYLVFEKPSVVYYKLFSFYNVDQTCGWIHIITGALEQMRKIEPSKSFCECYRVSHCITLYPAVNGTWRHKDEAAGFVFWVLHIVPHECLVIRGIEFSSALVYHETGYVFQLGFWLLFYPLV